MPALEIFGYSDYLSYLIKATKTAERSSKKSLSFGQWARKLGYRSPRTFAMVIKGQRLPSSQMRGRIARALCLGTKEKAYLDLLVELEQHHRQNKPAQAILVELEKCNPNIRNQRYLTTEEFASICPWYHLVLWQMVGSSIFQEAAQWSCERLGRKVSRREIEQALNRLEQLGLIRRNLLSQRLELGLTHFSTTSDLPSQAIRLHHRQMIQRALEALENQKVETREITSITFKMDRSRLNEAKKQIRAFRDSFHKEFESKNSNEVWQFNFQLFSHTQEN